MQYSKAILKNVKTNKKKVLVNLTEKNVLKTSGFIVTFELSLVYDSREGRQNGKIFLAAHLLFPEPVLSHLGTQATDASRVNIDYELPRKHFLNMVC